MYQQAHVEIRLALNSSKPASPMKKRVYSFSGIIVLIWFQYGQLGTRVLYVEILGFPLNLLQLLNHVRDLVEQL